MPGQDLRELVFFGLFLSVEFDASQLCCDYWIVVLLRCKNVKFTKHIECMNLYNKCVMHFCPHWPHMVMPCTYATIVAEMQFFHLDSVVSSSTFEAMLFSLWLHVLHTFLGNVQTALRDGKSSIKWTHRLCYWLNPSCLQHPCKGD